MGGPLAQGFDGGEYRGAGIGDHGITDCLEFLGGHKRRAPTLDHVGHARHGHGRVDPAHVLDRGHGLDKDHVRPGFGIEAGPADGLVDTVHGRGIGAGHDDEIRVLPGPERGLELGQIFLDRDHRLAGHVAAALGIGLVLDEKRGRAQAFDLAHRMDDVVDVAEPGVDVDHDRDIHPVDNVGVLGEHFGGRQYADVRHAEHASGRAVAGHGHGRKAGLGKDQGGQAVMGHGQHEDFGRLYEFAKTRGHFHGQPPMDRLYVQTAHTTDDGQGKSGNLGGSRRDLRRPAARDAGVRAGPCPSGWRGAGRTRRFGP